MGLVLVTSNELVAGKSLPWSLYDQMRNLLLNQGDIVRDDRHRDELLASGACHELVHEMSDGEENSDANLFITKESTSGQTGKDESGTSFTFDDMRLKVEDKLQLEPPSQLARERFFVKVIGFLRGVSLLVTVPVTANGLQLQLLAGETVVMRSFSGQNAFGFACTIEHISKTPYSYMHLSFPEQIKGMMIRKAVRVKAHLITAVRGNTAGADEQVTAIISNISANGASLDCKQALGDKGDILDLAFRVNLHGVDTYLSIKGVIRSVPGSGTADFVSHGIEFHDLKPNDFVVLQSMIYQQMIENPHKLM